jgi:hypothetical protein
MGNAGLHTIFNCAAGQPEIVGMTAIAKGMRVLVKVWEIASGTVWIKPLWSIGLHRFLPTIG